MSDYHNIVLILPSVISNDYFWHGSKFAYDTRHHDWSRGGAVLAVIGHSPKATTPGTGLLLSLLDRDTGAVFTMQNVRPRSGARAYAFSDDASADQRYWDACLSY